MVKAMKFNLVERFGLTIPYDDDDFNDALKFLQTIVYNGNDANSLLQTRIAMYEKQKEKSSLRLIPDASSCAEHVKRAWLQTNTWLQCMERIISHADPMDHGWQKTRRFEANMVYLPTVATKSAKKRKKKEEQYEK